MLFNFKIMQIKFYLISDHIDKFQKLLQYITIISIPIYHQIPPINLTSCMGQLATCNLQLYCTKDIAQQILQCPLLEKPSYIDTLANKLSLVTLPSSSFPPFSYYFISFSHGLSEVFRNSVKLQELRLSQCGNYKIGEKENSSCSQSCLLVISSCKEIIT